MKKIYIIISTIAALALTSACNLKSDYPPMSGENVLTLDLQYSEIGTKSDGVGNENAVNSVDYFFYNDTTKAPVYSKRDNNPTVTESKYNISVTAGEGGVPAISELFKNGKFEIFAVFNAPEAIAAADLATVKQTAVGLSFAHEEGGDWVVTNDGSEYFVMVGQKTVNKATSGEYANVQSEKTVEMKRLAAKVSLILNIAQSVQNGGLTWVPMLDDPTAVPPSADNVRLYLCNFVQNTLLGAADETPILPETYTVEDYADLPIATDSSVREDSDSQYVIPSQIDFYTYPIEWEAGADIEPNLKLILPWKAVEGTAPSKEIYYKIMFPADITSIEANKHYQLTANINTINDGEPVVVVEGYKATVVDWVADNSISAAVSDAKYLSVEKETIKFFTPTAGISFASSDPVEMRISKVSIYQNNISNSDGSSTPEYVVNNGNTNTNQRTGNSDIPVNYRSLTATGFRARSSGRPNVTEDWIVLDNTNHYLQVGHTLNSNLESNRMDVSPWIYEITLKLTVENGTTYDRTIRFEQWPNVYVTPDPNRGLNSTGGVYVNTRNTSSTQTGSPNYGGVHGLTGLNQNPNMYVLTISVSPTYTIGDPRGGVDNNPNEDGTTDEWSTESRWTEGSGTNHNLLFYHPASNTGTNNMIAPKLRIASSYGVCQQGISQRNAARRCASYQEDGIPAGRWRLPTMAEVQFISKLSALGRIPILFGSNNSTNYYYWTANGLIRVNNGRDEAEPADTGSSYSVRCVYDEWFWNDGDVTARPVNYNQFWWGDRNYQ